MNSKMIIAMLALQFNVSEGDISTVQKTESKEDENFQNCFVTIHEPLNEHAHSYHIS